MLRHRHIIIFLLSLLALCEGYLSCKCVRPSLQAQVTGAKNVFRGKVLKHTEDGTKKLYKVQILKSCRQEYLTYTPIEGTTVEVSTGTHSCGVLGLEDNKEYTFLTDSNYEISLCQWNGEADWKQVAEMCSALPPKPSPFPEEPPIFEPPRPPTFPSYPRPQEPIMSLKEAERRICDMCTRLQNQNGRQYQSHPMSGEGIQSHPMIQVQPMRPNIEEMHFPIQTMQPISDSASAPAPVSAPVEQQQQ